MDIIREDCIYARQSVDRKTVSALKARLTFAIELKRSCRYSRIRDCSTRDIFNYPQNDKASSENRSSLYKKCIGSKGKVPFWAFLI